MKSSFASPLHSEQIAMVKRALNDAPHCGDECSFWQSGGKIILCMVDGLGHGEHAERAAKAVVDYVAHHLSEPLLDLFAGCNLALRSTRRVVMGVAVIDEEAGTLTYAGIGNTRAMIVRERHPEFAEGKTVRLSNNYGIVGGGYKRLSPETVPLMPGDLVFMFTDGVEEIINLSGYDDALRADVWQLAEKIIKDWGRETDDVAVLIFKRS